MAVYFKLSMLYLFCGISSGTKFGNEVEIQNYRRGKECYGRYNGLSMSSNLHVHYQRLRRHYANCTHIRGNLEITYLDDPNIIYDLSFLSSIEVVTGYMLIALVSQNVSLPLDNLKIIRGDSTYSHKGRRYGLFVALNMAPENNSPGGLTELRMPSLREISNGDVLVAKSPFIPYVTTIDWDIIAPRARVTLWDFPRTTPTCHPDCWLGDTGRCWGPRSEDCQAVIPVMDNLYCHPSCPGRCYKSIERTGCCMSVCAGGCWGPLETHCLACKYNRLRDRCVLDCPPDTYRTAGNCVPI